MYISEQISLEENITKIMELGICSTCNDVDTCVRRQVHLKPVWDCDEFDNYVPQKAITRDLSYLSGDRSISSIQDLGISLKGLCMNCQIAANCIYPKSEGGVWHCNEYV